MPILARKGRTFPCIGIIMAYLIGALVMYVWSIGSLHSHPPEGPREILSVLLLCTAMAALWPLVLLWNLMIGMAVEEG